MTTRTRRIIATLAVVAALTLVGGVALRASASAESRTWTGSSCTIHMPSGPVQVRALWHNADLVKTGTVWIDPTHARTPQRIIRDRVGPYRGASGVISGVTPWTVPTVGFYSEGHVFLEDTSRQIHGCTTRPN